MLSGLGLRDPGLGNETEEPQHPNPSFLGVVQLDERGSIRFDMALRGVNGVVGFLGSKTLRSDGTATCSPTHIQDIALLTSRIIILCTTQVR